MQTRADLAREIERGRVAQRRFEKELAFVAVPGGLGQLALHAWLERRFDKAVTAPIELTVFVIYMLIVVVLFVRMNRAERRNTPACPSCGRRFSKMSASLAITTGRCDQCGAQVAE